MHDIPKHWGTKTLGEVCEISAGGDKPKEFSKKKTECYCYPVYSNGERNLGLQGYTNSIKINVPAITISARGTIGFVAKRKENFTPIVRLISVIPKEYFDLDCLYYVLKNMDYLSNGTATQQLTVPMVIDLPIPVPPLEEQKEIVAILDKSFARLDHALEACEKALKLSKELWQSSLDQALSPRDGWGTASLSECCTIKLGGTPDTKDPNYWNGNHQWITPKELGKLTTPYIDKTERTLTDKGILKAKIIKPYSVILSTRAPIGHIAINTVEMSTNQGCKSLEPNSNIYYKYLYFYILSKKTYLKSLGTGTTFKELSTTNLGNTAVPFPPLEEQQKIVAKLDKINDSIQKLQNDYKQKITTIKELKASLLNDAFTGKLTNKR